MDVLLKTKIGRLEFDLPIFNASGVWCTTKKELEDLGKSEASAIVFKTMTLEKRQGNPEPRFFLKDNFSINSMGLPNLGVDYYCSILKDLKKYKKPLIASIAGFSQKEFLVLFDKVNNASFDMVEVNLSCPNLEGKGLFAYDLKTSFSILKKIMKKTKKKVGVKLPPYFERETIKKVAEEFLKLKIDFVTLVNSYPLGCFIDVDKEEMVIKPNLGIGGLGGKVIQPISLAQVVLFYQYSKGRLPIVAVGGIEEASDIYRYTLAGACAFAVGTRLWSEGPEMFSRLKKELKEFLKQKKVKSLKEKMGKVKFL